MPIRKKSGNLSYAPFISVYILTRKIQRRFFFSLLISVWPWPKAWPFSWRRDKLLFMVSLVQSAEAVEYTDSISAEGVRPPPPSKCPGYVAKQSDGKTLLILELWGMQRTPSLLSLAGSIWPRVLSPNRNLFMGQIELNGVLMLN